MSHATHERVSALRALCVIAAVVIAGFAASASAVTIDWVTVGNAGNAADTTGFGAVGYEYNIATTEVTNAQYAEFLNAVAATDTNNLYNINMAGNFGGISRTGSSGSYVYTAQAGRENNPVTYVSWYDAARFSNWLTNGQGNGDTESGVYTLTGPTTISGITRDLNNPNQVFIPTEDEWYKSAYHDASAGTAGDYFLYAMGTDDVPYSDNPTSLNTPDDTNVANFGKDDSTANGYDDGYAVSGSASYPNSTNPFTDVGAYTDADSPYGTFDQNGNVWEWNETPTGSSRGFRGGSWFIGEVVLRSSFRNFNNPTLENNIIGFRVASPIPEPASAILLTLGAPLMLRRRRG